MYVYFELFSLQLEVHAHLGLQCKYIILESVYVCVCVEHINSLRYVLSTEYLLIFRVCMYLSVCMCIHTCMCVCVCLWFNVYMYIEHINSLRYATSSTITMHSVLIHDYYSKREPPPVYVTIDGKLKSGRLEIKAYIRYMYM